MWAANGADARATKGKLLTKLNKILAMTKPARKVDGYQHMPPEPPLRGVARGQKRKHKHQRTTDFLLSSEAVPANLSTTSTDIYGTNVFGTKVLVSDGSELECWKKNFLRPVCNAKCFRMYVN